MWSRVPSTLLQESARQQMDRTTNNVLVLTMPYLQGGHEPLDAGGAAGAHPAAVRGGAAQGAHAAGVRGRRAAGARQAAARPRRLRHGALRLLRLPQVRQGLLRRAGALRGGLERLVGARRAGVRRVQRRGRRAHLSQARRRLPRVQVPLLLLRGGVLLFRHVALLQRVPRRLPASDRHPQAHAAAVPRRAQGRAAARLGGRMPAARAAPAHRRGVRARLRRVPPRACLLSPRRIPNISSTYNVSSYYRFNVISILYIRDQCFTHSNVSVVYSRNMCHFVSDLIL